MYLSELKIWNFRKYGGTELEKEPALKIEFNKGLNVLIGENNSGKTAIVDAIKYVLKTNSYEYIRLEEKDFFQETNGERKKEMKIECHFKDLTECEGGKFLEWVTFDSLNYTIKCTTPK